MKLKFKHNNITLGLDCVKIKKHIHICIYVQGGSNMTGTDLCVSTNQSRSYLNHPVYEM